MKDKMKSADALAIDVLLSRSNTGADMRSFSANDQPSPGQIAAMNKILGLLQILPAADPPADLVARTMQRIARSKGNNLNNTGVARDIGIRPLI